jgi:hypothetical protein
MHRQQGRHVGGRIVAAWATRPRRGLACGRLDCGGVCWGLGVEGGAELRGQQGGSGMSAPHLGFLLVRRRLVFMRLRSLRKTSALAFSEM